MIRNVPIPTAGVSLGLVALGGLLGTWSGMLQCVLVALSIAMAALVVAKACLFPAMVRDDLQHPILASVSATLFMALMQIAAFFAPYAFVPSMVLWGLAVAGHLFLMAWFTFAHVRGLKLENVFPTYFICYVGIVAGAVTSPAFGLQALGEVLFWVGFASYPVLMVLITVRCLRHPTPHPARPLLCIFSAPASLSVVGYLAAAGEPNLGFAMGLLVVGQIMFVLVLTQLPKFVQGGFFPSFAAMTFPFVITATALVRFGETLAGAGMQVPVLLEAASLAETAFAAFMVAFVFVHYVRFLAKPVFADVAEDDPAPVEAAAAE